MNITPQLIEMNSLTSITSEYFCKINKNIPFRLAVRIIIIIFVDLKPTLFNLR